MLNTYILLRLVTRYKIYFIFRTAHHIFAYLLFISFLSLANTPSYSATFSIFQHNSTLDSHFLLHCNTEHYYASFQSAVIFIDFFFQ